MPPSKRQKTGKKSSIDTQNEDPIPASTHKGDQNADKDGRQNSGSDSDDNSVKGVKKPDIGPYEYMCITRPDFDYKAENALRGDEQLEYDELFKKEIKPGFEADQADNILCKPASEHNDRKWVIMLDAWDKFDLWNRQAKYRNPDMFGMYIYNDWHGYALMELVENMLIEFENGFKKNGGDSLDRMWAAVSATGYSLNSIDLAPLTWTEDNERFGALAGLVGCALLTTLEHVRVAGELKPDSKYRDLPLVIGYFLMWGDDLEEYDVEGNAVSWRTEANTYYQEAGLSPEQGVASMSELFETLKSDSKAKTKKKVKRPESGKEKDSWGWKKQLNKYKKDHVPVFGGQRHDITKMSRAERAQYAFDGKDPLKDMTQAELKQNLLDWE